MSVDKILLSANNSFCEYYYIKTDDSNSSCMSSIEINFENGFPLSWQHSE